MDNHCAICGSYLADTGRMVCEKCEKPKKAEDCFEEVTKIKTHFAKIIVEGTAEKPYYSILYYDPTKKEYFNGYGSYFIGNVFNWLSECFEIVEAPTVDAVEVVHAKWEYIPIIDGLGRYRCERCFHYVDAGTDRNYCPNCGAKMDGGNDDA